MIKGRVLVHSHKRSQVTGFIAYRSQEWGNELGEGQSSILGQEGAGDREQGSKQVPATYKVAGTEVTHSIFMGWKRCLRKSKAGTWGRDPAQVLI